MNPWSRLACVLAMLLVGLSCGDPPDVYSISVPNLKIGQDTSIVSIEISFEDGTVEAVENVPTGWSINITNDIRLNSRVTGAAIASSAFLSASEFKRIDFIVRRKITEESKFNVHGIFGTSKGSGRPQKMEISMGDFDLAVKQ